MMMMMKKKIKRVYWILNSSFNNNNETNYFMSVIDDYCMACCTHFTSSCVPDKYNQWWIAGRAHVKRVFFKSHTHKMIVKCIQQFRQEHFNESLKKIFTTA